MPLAIIVKHDRFHLLKAALYNILSDSDRVVKVVIQSKKIVFTTIDGHTVTVQTDDALNHFEVAEFFTTDFLQSFSASSQLLQLLGKYKKELVIKSRNGRLTTVDLELSR